MDFLLVIAVILLGARLPAYMNRLGMPKMDKILFVILMFSILGAAWYTWHVFGMFI